MSLPITELGKRQRLILPINKSFRGPFPTLQFSAGNLDGVFKLLELMARAKIYGREIHRKALHDRMAISAGDEGV